MPMHVKMVVFGYSHETPRESRSSDPEKGEKKAGRQSTRFAGRGNSLWFVRVYQWRLLFVLLGGWCASFAKHLARWKSRILRCLCWFVGLLCHVLLSQDPAELIGRRVGVCSKECGLFTAEP
jgi:hypothetical protein